MVFPDSSSRPVDSSRPSAGSNQTLRRAVRTPYQPDTGLAAYQVVLSLPLPVAQVAWLLVALHHAAGEPEPPPQLAASLAQEGPVLSWRALQTIAALDAQRLAHLRRVFGAPDFHQHLARLLATLAHTSPAPLPATRPAPAPAQWPRLPPPPPHHPLGVAVPFPPRVAQALKVEMAVVIGTPISLPGFPFSDQIVHFREAITRPTPTTAVVIGGGYVGAEVALGWATAGAAVILIERGDRLMPQYDASERAAVRALLRDSGVQVRLKTRATAWARRGEAIVVTCESHGIVTELSAERVLVAVGVHNPGPAACLPSAGSSEVHQD